MKLDVDFYRGKRGDSGGRGKPSWGFDRYLASSCNGSVMGGGRELSGQLIFRIAGGLMMSYRSAPQLDVSFVPSTIPIQHASAPKETSCQKPQPLRSTSKTLR